jgi:hypothetical protein
MSVPDSATVPARDGYEWIRLSLRLFRMQWLRYCSIAALFILILQIAGALTGGILSAFIYPILKVGFLAATWHHERGELPSVAHLAAGFRSNLRALLPIGLFCVVAFHAAMLFAQWASGLEATAFTVEQIEKDPALRETFVRFTLVLLACFVPISAAIWFASALVVFDDASGLQALLKSFTAWTRNVFAVAVYALTLFALQFAMMLSLVVLVVLTGGVGLVLGFTIAIVPLIAITMISDYVSYRRVFHRSERLQVAATK